MRPMRTVFAQADPRVSATRARVRNPSVNSFLFMKSSFRLQSPWVRGRRTGLGEIWNRRIRITPFGKNKGRKR